MLTIRSLWSILFSVLLILALTTALVTPAAAAPVVPVQQDDGGEGDDASDDAQDDENVYDEEFIDFMVPAHEAAIAMYELAIERGVREELQTFLLEEIQTAEAENELMRQYREEWYGSSETPPPSAIPTFPETPWHELGVETLDATVHLEQLQSLPDELFEVVFLDKAIELNHEAVFVSLVARHHAGTEEIDELSQHMAVAHHHSAYLFGLMRDTWYFGLESPPAEDPEEPDDDNGNDNANDNDSVDDGDNVNGNENDSVDDNTNGSDGGSGEGQ